jgi:hypothetical protein
MKSIAFPRGKIQNLKFSGLEISTGCFLKRVSQGVKKYIRVPVQEVPEHDQNFELRIFYDENKGVLKNGL